MSEQTRETPGWVTGGTQKDSSGDWESSTSIPNEPPIRLNADGFQIVDADNPVDDVPWEIRSAIWTDAYKVGYRAGMCAHIRKELGALADAADLLSWLEARVLAHAEHGEAWADLIAGEHPNVGGHRGC